MDHTLNLLSSLQRNLIKIRGLQPRPILYVIDVSVQDGRLSGTTVVSRSKDILGDKDDIEEEVVENPTHLFFPLTEDVLWVQ